MLTDERIAELAAGIFNYRGDKEPSAEVVYFIMQGKKAIRTAIRETQEACAVKCEELAGTSAADHRACYWCAAAIRGVK